MTRRARVYALCIALGAPIPLIAGRALALWALSACFRAWNLTIETYPYAPAWARAIADSSGDVALAAGLVIACAYLLFLGRARIGRPRAGECLAFFGLGALAACVLTGALLLAGSARAGRGGAPFASLNPLDIALDALTALFFACARANMAACARLRAHKYALCGVMQAALCAYLWGLTPWALAANALVFGCLMCGLCESRGGVWPEVSSVFAFRLVSRRILGYPGGYAYPVSEGFLTGESAGLEGAGITLILLTIIACAYIARGLRGRAAKGR